MIVLRPADLLLVDAPVDDLQLHGDLVQEALDVPHPLQFPAPFLALRRLQFAREELAVLVLAEAGGFFRKGRRRALEGLVEWV